MSPSTSSIVQIIFSFRSFYISDGILSNQKFIIGLDSYSNRCFNVFGTIWILLVFLSTVLLKDAKYSTSVWLHVARLLGH